MLIKRFTPHGQALVFGNYLSCSIPDLNKGFHKISRNSLEFLQVKHFLPFDDEVALFKTQANTHKFILGDGMFQNPERSAKNGFKMQGTC